ncbi:MAG: phosphotransferase, partial [Acidimicrobiia bacterium]|nr:phosphotransferase [Acidimicrobiia bacterium]
MTIPTGVDDLTAEWLTGALDLGRVTSVAASPIGTGQVADSVRLELGWDPAGAGPDTLVAKVTAASDASRQAAVATRTYEVEVGFYTDLARTVG